MSQAKGALDPAQNFLTDRRPYSMGTKIEWRILPETALEK